MPAPPLPPALNRAVTQPGGVVLVLGAGCSFEDPTNLPLSPSLSQEIHDKLVADGLLEGGDCDEPSDLSLVADAVYQKHGEQRPVVERMEPSRFKNATPNDGHKIAAALLVEHALAFVVTLNFDHAMSGALAWVGAENNVAQIARPEQHSQLGTANLVYLHRKMGDGPEELILRTKSLEKAWQGGWEEVITRAAMTRSATVFVGLGSPADVLTTSAERIKRALGGQVELFQVDIKKYEDQLASEEDQLTDDRGKSLTEKLGVDSAHYVQCGWCDFMEALGARVLKEHLRALRQACVDADASGDKRQDVEIRFQSLCDQIETMGLLSVGKMRALWFGESGEYLPDRLITQAEWMASLVCAVEVIARHLGTLNDVKFVDDGCAYFGVSGYRRPVPVRLIHGRGSKKWGQLELEDDYSPSNKPAFVVGEGFTGLPPSDFTPPPDIADDPNPGDIVHVDTTPKLVWAGELHQNVEIVDDLFS